MRSMLILAVVLASLSAAAESASACGYTRTAPARPDHHRGHRGALFIGDSTGIFAVPKLARRGIAADAKECRQFPEGLAIIRSRRAAGSLPHLVILGLGANAPLSSATVRTALDAIGGGRVLGLVTPRNLGSSAEAMRAVARAHPRRVVLIDWRAASAGHDSWFAGDGLHVTDEGARHYARLIRRRSRGVVAPPGDALPRLGRAEPRRRCGAVRRPSGLRVAVAVLRGPTGCRAARRLARAEPLALRSRWSWSDWRPTRLGSWRDVYVRDQRRRIIATR